MRSHDQDLDVKRIQLLYRSGISTTSGTLLAAALFSCWIETTPHHLNFRWWLGAMVVASCYRFSLHALFARAGSIKTEWRKYELLHASGLLATAIGWGFAGSLWLPDDSNARTILIIITMSLVAGGAASYSVSRSSTTAVIVPMVLPLLISLLADPTAVNISQAILCGAFTASFLARALGGHDSVLEVLKLAMEKELLAKELLEAQQRVNQASKLSALGQMAGGIAHEINNPLAVIQMKVSQLQRLIETDTLENSQAISFLSQVESTVTRISKITKGLHLIARDGSSDEFEESRVLDIVQSVVSLCGERLRFGGVDLKIVIDPSLSCECRGVQISQILLNLINNSYDAIADQPDKWIEVRALDSQGWVDLSVTDSGPGINDSIAEKLMTPFFTTKAVGQGTGLGLSISRSLAIGHGGSLEFDPLSPHTKFKLRLPKRQMGELAS